MYQQPIGKLRVPAVAVTHGIVTLRRELAELQRIGDLGPDNWPDWFEPNDLGLYRSVLAALEQAEPNGYENEYWWGKPFRFFVSLLTHYIHNEPSVSDQDRAAIEGMLCEYHVRCCLLFSNREASAREGTIENCVSALIKLFRPV